MPFLKHDNFSVCGVLGITSYIINLTGRHDLLGKTIEHQIIIDSFFSKFDIREIMLGASCKARPLSQ